MMTKCKPQENYQNAEKGSTGFPQTSQRDKEQISFVSGVTCRYVSMFCTSNPAASIRGGSMPVEKRSSPTSVTPKRSTPASSCRPTVSAHRHTVCVWISAMSQCEIGRKLQKSPFMCVGRLSAAFEQHALGDAE